MASALGVLGWAGMAPVMRPASAHDIYTALRDRTGYLCCSGDDCEAVGSDFAFTPDGGAMLRSRRYGQWVRIARDKISFLVVKGGEGSEAHWCGRPRTVYERGLGSDQADDGFWTYCAFISPRDS
jgi:hypothetical protein